VLKAVFTLNKLGLRTKVVGKLVVGRGFQSQLILLSNKNDYNLFYCIVGYNKNYLASVKIDYSNFAYKKPLKNLSGGKSQQWGANYAVYPVRVAVIPNSNLFARLASVIEVIVNDLYNSTFTCNKTTLTEEFYCKNDWSVVSEKVPSSKPLVPQKDLLFNVYESVWNITDRIRKKYNNTVKSCTKNKRESTRWLSFISYNEVYKIAVCTWAKLLSWVKCHLRKEEGIGKKEGRSLYKGILTSIKNMRTVQLEVLKINKEGVSNNLLASYFFLLTLIHLLIKSAKYNRTLSELLSALQMFLAQMFLAQLLSAQWADFYLASQEQKMLSFRHCSEEIKGLRKYNGTELIAFLIKLANYNKLKVVSI
jgi:hypothetical protein